MKATNSKSKLSRKEVERLRRRYDILKAARQLFLAKGYVNTTLDEIAQLAEFGKGTIYNYFANKEELLWGLIEQFLEENIALATREIQEADGTAREKFRAYANTVVILGREHEFFHMIMKEAHILEAQNFDERLQLLVEKIHTIWQIISRVIAKEIKAGHFRKGNALLMAGLFDMMIRSFGTGTSRKEFPIKNTSREEVVDLIVTTFFDGVEIQSDKGRKK